MKKWKQRMMAVALVSGMVLQPMAGMAADYASARGTAADYENGLQDKDTPAPVKRGAVPNPAQLKYYRDETSAFIHFGINTFTGDEWSDGTRDPKLYAPAAIDADQWVREMKAAGFKKIIITAKHHDGFQLWSSQYSDYNVAHSGDKNKVDVLAELSRACTEQDMNMGLYMSPWDRHEPSYGIPVDNQLRPTQEEDKNGDYNEYYLNQLEEILADDKYGNDGHFCEIWMDGAKRGNVVQPYALKEWWEYCRSQETGPDGIRGTEDDVILFNNIGEDIRWVGNESGYSYDPIWPQVSKTKMWNDYNYGIGGTPENPRPPVLQGDGTYAPASYEDGGYLTRGQYDGDQWSMPEADYSIIGDWFYKTGKAPMSGADIAKRYFQSVGNATPMLLNLPPNKDGRLEDSYVKSLKEYREIIDNTFETNLAENAVAYADYTRGNAKKFSANNVLDGDPDTYWSQDDGQKTGSITVELDGEQQFDVIDIKEYIELGQNISEYSLDVRVDGAWQPFGIKHYTGDTNSARKAMKTIGARSLVRGYTVNADAVRLNIKASHGVPSIREIGVYKMDSRIEYSGSGAENPKGMTFMDSHSAVTTGSWDKNDGDTDRVNSMLTSDRNATATYTFTGSKFYLSSRHSWNFGAMEVTVDGGTPFLVDLYSKVLDKSVLVYESEELEYKQHTVLIRPHTSPTSDKPTKIDIATDGLFYLDNQGRGMLELTQEEVEVKEADKVNLTIKRIGGSLGEAAVHVQTDPGTAVQGDAFEPLNEDIVFKDGEKEKQISVQTLESLRPGNLEFYVKLTAPKNAILGSRSKTTVVIINKDVPIDMEELDHVIAQAEAKQMENFALLQWRQLESALTAAKAVRNTPGVNQDAVDAAAAQLAQVLQSVREKDTYVDLLTTEPVSAEAEDMELGSGVSIFLKKDYPKFEAASGSGIIGDISAAGGAKMYFNAPAAGTYELTVDYYSGNGSNQIYWRNGKQGELAVTGTMNVKPEANGFDQVKTNIQIKEKGMQHLEFLKPASQDSPNLDKITLQYKGELKLPEHVSIAPQDLRLRPGETRKLSAQILPSDSTAADICWFAEDSPVLSIGRDGTVTALSVGQAKVFAVTENSLEAWATVNVTEEQINRTELETLIQSFDQSHYTPQSWKKFAVTLEEAKKALASDSQAVIDAAVKNLKAAAASLEKRADMTALRTQYEAAKKLDLSKYTSESVQTLTGLYPQIEALLKNADAVQKDADALCASLKDAVQKLELIPASIKLTADRKVLGVKEKLALKLTVKPLGAPKGKLQYKSSNPKILSVNAKGVVQGKRTGKATITVTSSYNQKSTLRITVKKAPKDVKLTASKKKLKVGKTLQLKTVLTKGSAGKVTYQSASKKKASVNSRGVVKGLKPGKVMIRVKTYNGKKASVRLQIVK